MDNLNITRKCFYCKKQINLDNDNFIYTKKKYYHFNCVIDEQLNKKRNKIVKEECIKNAIALQKANQKEINDIITREKLFRWIQYSYNIVVIPKYFYIKMDSIFDGTYKGIRKGIPPEDLLDIWKRKKNELDRINDLNNRKGKLLIGSDRIQYDLAILLSKYDSYLRWKEQQKLLEDEKQNIIAEITKPKINYELINKSIENQTKDENINDLLDEVF